MLSLPHESRMPASASRPYLYMNNQHYDHVDVLPYIDAFNSELESEIKTLIQDEMQVIQQENQGQIPDYLQSSFPISPSYYSPANSIIGKELQRCQQGIDMDFIDLDRYQHTKEPSVHASLKEWTESLEKIKPLIEYARNGLMNLELMVKFGKASWLTHLNELERLQKSWEKNVKEIKIQTDELNKRRKLEQIDCGNQMRNMNRIYEDCLQRNSKLLETLMECRTQMLQLRNTCDAMGLSSENCDQLEAMPPLPTLTEFLNQSITTLAIPASQNHEIQRIQMDAEDEEPSDSESITRLNDLDPVPKPIGYLQ